ncbi:sulfatase [Flammeovirga sp. MY04]|uniref:sulfatase n=1 Tax=Flammeovirga sp. MY04 TaxID=1191459 RepID=UPI000806215E|nr:sulfatase [Flammeovirga sp. MY04]ANQ49525.1 sulfatase [Flammeovirga sp. MY04]
MIKSILKLVFGFCLLSNASAQNDKPNILLINVDDLGWSDVGYQGNDIYQTPNIDQLAKESISFINGYAGAANCAPSRACLITGQTTTRHGISTVGSSNRGAPFTRKLNGIPTKTKLKTDALTMGSILKEHGYQTAMFGKWHVSDDARDMGFDYTIAGGHKGQPKSYFSPYKMFNIEDKEEGEFLTDRLTNEAIHYLSNVKNKEQPFFLYLPFFAIHTPLMGKPELIEKYRGKKFSDGHRVNPIYAALVENTDWNVGRLLTALDQLGLTEDTIIIFTSDNGGIYTYSHQLPLRAGKGSYYEGGIKVPTLFKWKGHWKAGVEVDTRVTHLDYLPTLLDLINVEAPDNYPLDGESIKPLIEGKKKFDHDRVIVYHFPIYLQAYTKGGDDARDPLFRTRPGSVIIKGNWKLHYYYEDQGMELYNLETDISERNNLVDKHPKKAKSMYRLLQEWIQEHGGEIPTEVNLEYDAVRAREEIEKHI